MITINTQAANEAKVLLLKQVVGKHIDDAAKAEGFDSIVTAVTYADEPADALLQQRGIQFREWRSMCWANCRDLLEAWQGGGEEPTVESIIQSLPSLG